NAIVRSGVRDKPDIAALASLDAKTNKLCVMSWYYHDDDLPGPEAKIELTLDGLPGAAGQAKGTHYRIDAGASNAYTVWKQMGSPQEPTNEQYLKLEQAGHLATVDAPLIQRKDGQTSLSFDLPRQGISLLVLQWPQKESAAK